MIRARSTEQLLQQQPPMPSAPPAISGGGGPLLAYGPAASSASLRLWSHGIRSTLDRSCTQKPTVDAPQETGHVRDVLLLGSGRHGRLRPAR